MSNDPVHTEEIERRIQECANGMLDSIKDNNRAVLISAITRVWISIMAYEKVSIDLFDEALDLLRQDYILRLKQRE